MTGRGARSARTLTPIEQARAAALAGEGMPASWIAEDLDVTRSAVAYAGAAMSSEDVTSWRVAWAHIRRHPPLLALHAEFAPPVRYR